MLRKPFRRHSMGKKKSVVLLTLITIVILVFCAISAIPSFPLSVFKKDSVKVWKPATAQYDLDADLSGGQYTHYYPEGVISALEYDAVKEEKQAKVDQAGISDEQKAEYQAELDEYVSSYTPHKGLYLSTDTELDIVKFDSTTNEYYVTEGFKAAFKDTANAVAKRFEARGYSAYRVSVVDDYALKAELPASEANAVTVFSYFAYTGEFTIASDTETLFPSKADGDVSGYFKSFKAKVTNDSPYIEIKTTKKGSAKLKELTASEASTLNFKVGENAVLSPAPAYIAKQSDNVWVIGMNDLEVAKTVCTVLTSALEHGDTGLTFVKVDNSSYGVYEAVYGSNARTLLFVAVGIALLLLIALPIVKYGGFGVAMAYSTLTYFGITAFCFAFITEKLMEVTAGTAIVFLLGLIVTLLLSARTHAYIKKEFSLGKTVESSVKMGFKKTLMGAIDVCAVLLLGSVALLIGAAGLHTLAIQAIVCAVTAAFCSLLWTRVVNYLLLSAAKDKYKYFRFVREDDDDE